jgi:hypothetical protein
MSTGPIQRNSLVEKFGNMRKQMLTAVDINEQAGFMEEVTSHIESQKLSKWRTDYQVNMASYLKEKAALETKKRTKDDKDEKDPLPPPQFPKLSDVILTVDDMDAINDDDATWMLLHGFASYVTDTDNNTSHLQNAILSQAKKGNLKLLVANRNLVFGVNIPLSVVLVTSGFSKNATRNTMCQLIGRVGRKNTGTTSAKVLFEDDDLLRLAILPVTDTIESYTMNECMSEVINSMSSAKKSITSDTVPPMLTDYTPCASAYIVDTSGDCASSSTYIADTSGDCASSSAYIADTLSGDCSAFPICMEETPLCNPVPAVCTLQAIIGNDVIDIQNPNSTIPPALLATLVSRATTTSGRPITGTRFKSSTDIDTTKSVSSTVSSTVRTLQAIIGNDVIDIQNHNSTIPSALLATLVSRATTTSGRPITGTRFKSSTDIDTV